MHARSQKQSHYTTSKKYLVFILQLAITAAILALLFHDQTKRAQMVEALSRADWRWLFVGILAYGAVEILGAIQWQLLLRIQHFELQWRKAAAIFFIGVFFTAFTPGLIAGDAAQIFYLVKERPERKADAVLVVVMDRILGLFSLVFLTVTAALLRMAWLRQTALSARLFEATLALLVVASLGLAGAAVAAKLRGLHQFVSRLGLTETLRDIHAALGCYRMDWKRTVMAFWLTVLAHLFYFSTFYCAERAIVSTSVASGMHTPSLGEMFAIMPIVNTFTALPISLAGIGVRESLFQVLLHDLCQVPEALGVLVGALGFVIRLFWGLPGAVALFYEHPRNAAS